MPDKLKLLSDILLKARLYLVDLVFPAIICLVV